MAFTDRQSHTDSDQSINHRPSFLTHSRAFAHLLNERIEERNNLRDLRPVGRVDIPASVEHLAELGRHVRWDLWSVAAVAHALIKGLDVAVACFSARHGARRRAKIAPFLDKFSGRPVGYDCLLRFAALERQTSLLE